MTVNRIVYLYALFFSFVFFVLLDQYLFHLIFIFLLILPLVSLLFALPLRKKVRYRMDVEDDIVPKCACSIRLTAENTDAFPCACVRFHLSRGNALGRIGDQYAETSENIVQFSLGAHRSLTLQPILRMTRCGREDISIRRVDICDLLGLFSIPVPPQNGGSSAVSIYVLPELQTRSIHTEDAADLGLDSATYSTQKPGSDPSEVFQLRDYREGDPRHSVHWKLSSRLGRLIVRDFGLPLNPSMHFLLELREDANSEAAESMIGAALAFSEYLMAREITHFVSWLGEGGLLRTISVTGAGSLAAVLHDLLALPAQANWSSLERFSLQAAPQSETHLVYLIAGTLNQVSESEDAGRMLASLLELEVCRRVTLMPERCSMDAAQSLAALGCEVQLLGGVIPLSDAEDAL